ncbi:MAG TPA: hypothetical protein VKC62_08480 [Gaiellaceae bacterium]|nr:hypothetical protein [Gaiellaceae bacterium]
MPADVGEEELQAVGRAGELGGRLDARRLLLRRLFGGVGSGGLGRARRGADLEPDPLELGRQLLDLLVGQVELEGERLQLRGLQVAALLRRLDEGASLVGLEQLVQLVLAQGLISPLGSCVDVSEPSHFTRELLCMPEAPSSRGRFRLATLLPGRLFRRGGLGGFLRLRADGEVELHLALLI